MKRLLYKLLALSNDAGHWVHVSDILSGDLRSTCRHEESLYGRCIACGMTWDQQAEQRASR